MFSNDHSALSLCNSQFRLLYLLNNTISTKISVKKVGQIGLANEKFNCFRVEIFLASDLHLEQVITIEANCYCI